MLADGRAELACGGALGEVRGGTRARLWFRLFGVEELVQQVVGRVGAGADVLGLGAGELPEPGVFLLVGAGATCVAAGPSPLPVEGACPSEGVTGVAEGQPSSMRRHQAAVALRLKSSLQRDGGDGVDRDFSLVQLRHDAPLERVEKGSVVGLAVQHAELAPRGA